MKFFAVVILAALMATGAAIASQHAGKTVKVSEKEWGMPAVPAKVAHGKVTFVVRDVGHLKHEFVVIKTKRSAGKLPVKGARAVETGRVGKIKAFGPGQTRKLTLTLKPGHYALICNLAAHYKAGQHTDFTVK
jgi:uncharacterized cupredoxin-like copper-binding protein